MCLSVLSDDLSINEASDLKKNLLLEEPWALARFWSEFNIWALGRFWSEFNIGQIRSPSTLCCKLHTTVWCAVNCFLQISASYCTSRYGCNIVDTRSPTMKTVYCILILVQHHPVANTQCNLNIEHFDPGATHCRDQMLHTLDCRSNSNHITCCKFGSSNQRETQRGTWGVNGTDVRLVRSKTR